DVVGGAGANSLTLGGSDFSWEIDGPDSGVAHGVLDVSFSGTRVMGGGGGVLTVQGGQAGNAYVINPDGGVGSTITINGSTMLFDPGSANSIDVEGGGGTNSLVVDGFDHTWTIDGVNSGVAHAALDVAFHNVQYLGGSGGNDTFRLADGGS